MILTKTGETKGASFYQNGNGEKYLVRSVNREYKGRQKPPEFYLEKLTSEGPKYISGLFRTVEEGVYSYDLKDSVTGVRVMFNAVFREQGEQLELKKRVKE